MQNINLKVNNLEVKGTITNDEFTQFKTTATNDEKKAEDAEKKAEEAHKKATEITNPPSSGTTLSVGSVWPGMGAGF